MAISHNSTDAATIIAAPGAGKRLAIDFLTLNPSGGANSITLGFGISPVFVLNDNQPLTFENAIHDPEGIMSFDDNQAFTIDLSAATLVEGFVRYRIIGT